MESMETFFIQKGAPFDSDAPFDRHLPGGGIKMPRKLDYYEYYRPGGPYWIVEPCDAFHSL